MTESKLNLSLLEKFVTMRIFMWTVGVIIALTFLHFNLTFILDHANNQAFEQKASKVELLQMDSRMSIADREAEARFMEQIKRIETRFDALEKKLDSKNETLNVKLDKILLQGKH